MQADSCNSVKREMFMYDQQNLYQSNQIDFARVITEPFEIALVINFITAHDSKTHIVVRDYTSCLSGTVFSPPGHGYIPSGHRKRTNF